MRAFLYILGASSKSDHVKCLVPFPIDADEVFFGPCMKRLRDQFHNMLAPDRDIAMPHEDLYMVGFNGSNDAQERKIVWAGRVKRVMTFARAWNDLVGPRYQVMRNHSASPLHVEPIEDDAGRHVGYRHATKFHIEEPGKWIKDLTKKPGPCRYVTDTDKREIRVMDGVTPWDAFQRDVCLLLDNIFFAHGAGIEVDDDMLEILRAVQPEKLPDTIDSHAVFGRQKNGSADGKRNDYLKVEGELARRLMAIIKKRAHELTPKQAPICELEARARCDC